MTHPVTPTPPIVCDMTDAPDTATERVFEYERLFAESLIGRERTDGGIRLRFGLRPGMEDWVRDLAAREKACCAFFTFTIDVHGDELWWDASVVDDDIARQILDELYCLPDTVTEGAAALRAHLADHGLVVMVEGLGTLRPATTAELGLSESGSTAQQ
jgi:hypothetical protein